MDMEVWLRELDIAGNRSRCAETAASCINQKILIDKNKYGENRRRLDALWLGKFIIGVALCGRFDNDQSPTGRINGGWHLNNFAQTAAK